MFGPYTAQISKKQKIISYVGNKIFKPVKNIENLKIRERKVDEILKNKEYWYAIQKINNTIFFSSVDFFKNLGAEFVALPLITRMISSPGAALIDILKLKGKARKIALETIPISLKWFDFARPVFLAESSQLYLEISLVQNQKLKHVFSIYNSFRKEKADQTHLCEFHHIEYEGKVQQNENKKIIISLLMHLIKQILNKNEEELRIFLSKDDIHELTQFTKKSYYVELSLKEAFEKLYQETNDKTYLSFTSLNWSKWEEIKTTELFENKFVLVSEFPLEEIPFYQAPKTPKKDEEMEIINYKGRSFKVKITDGRVVGDNTDVIFPGYREVVGSGHRVRNEFELRWQLEHLFFDLLNLSKEEADKLMEWYIPYFKIRKSKSYVETSGFGLGWERFLQGILKMPTIVDVTHYPRLHFSVKP